MNRRNRMKSTARASRVTPGLAGAGLLTLALAGCGGGTDPLAEPGGGTAGGSEPAGAATVVVGSQQYYSNEIIAELYAQALEDEGIPVEREYQIGQREVYMPELESGAIDVMPEYSGNLLEYYDSESTASSPEEIATALEEVLPAGLRTLPAAEATDQDTYTVTSDFAEQYSLMSIGDLANVDEPIVIGANSEFTTRPYGPEGLQEVYGVEATVTPIEDSGGPLTVQALLDGDVNVADIYSADPAIAANDLVTLEDPENLILPQNVTPVVSENVDDTAAAAINEVNELLTTEELIDLNAQSIEEQASSADIASQWLTEQGLIDE